MNQDQINATVALKCGIDHADHSDCRVIADDHKHIQRVRFPAPIVTLGSCLNDPSSFTSHLEGCAGYIRAQIARLPDEGVDAVEIVEVIKALTQRCFVQQFMSAYARHSCRSIAYQLTAELLPTPDESPRFGICCPAALSFGAAAGHSRQALGKEKERWKWTLEA